MEGITIVPAVEKADQVLAHQDLISSFCVHSVLCPQSRLFMCLASSNLLNTTSYPPIFPLSNPFPTVLPKESFPHVNLTMCLPCHSRIPWFVICWSLFCVGDFLHHWVLSAKVEVRNSHLQPPTPTLPHAAKVPARNFGSTSQKSICETLIWKRNVRKEFLCGNQLYLEWQKWLSWRDWLCFVN